MNKRIAKKVKKRVLLEVCKAEERIDKAITKRMVELEQDKEFMSEIDKEVESLDTPDKRADHIEQILNDAHVDIVVASLKRNK